MIYFGGSLWECSAKFLRGGDVGENCITDAATSCE